MKRLIHQSTILAIILLVATSCLDIQESVYLRENGSGKFALTVNLENMESLLKLAEKLSADTETGKDIFTETEVDFEELRKKLERQPGISNVVRIQENNNKLLGIAFDFDDVSSLNRAMQEFNESNSGAQDYFTFHKGQLTRSNTLDITDKVQGEIEHETDIDVSVNGMMLGSIMKDMSYTTKYTFEKPVKKTSNPASRVSNEGRTVTLTYHFFDQEAGASSLENDISF
jgi:hypothetical protein